MTTDLARIDERLQGQQQNAIRLLAEARSLIEQAAEEIMALRTESRPNEEPTQMSEGDTPNE